MPKVNSESLASAVNAGKLLTQFSDALKPAAFISSWTGQKSGWINKAQKVSDAISMAKTVSSLAGFIKPSLLKDGFNSKSLTETAGTVKTMTDAAGLLKTLEGGLNLRLSQASWAGQRSGWLSALNLLK
ncbi:MAG: hypothetical protein H7122_09030 [Chitinophagaceae bacterium]|nr:hypothetical protein [Chitinophagaceae bacterium]